MSSELAPSPIHPGSLPPQKVGKVGKKSRKDFPQHGGKSEKSSKNIMEEKGLKGPFHFPTQIQASLDLRFLWFLTLPFCWFLEGALKHGDQGGPGILESYEDSQQGWKTRE